MTEKDSVSFYTALAYVEKGYTKNQKLYPALLLKVHILASLEEWGVALEQIDRLILAESGTRYLSLMYKGFILHKLEQYSNAINAYGESLTVINSAKLKDAAGQRLTHKIVLHTLLFGEEEGIKKLNQIYEETGNEYLKQFYDNMFPVFDIDHFIDQYVFVKPTVLNSDTNELK